MHSHTATNSSCKMKFLLVLAAFLALSSASHLFYGKKDYSDFAGVYDKDFVQDEGLYGKYHGLGWLYGQQQGLDYYKYAPFFQGRQDLYGDYYGKDYLTKYSGNDYYGKYYGNKDYFGKYYGNYYGNQDSYYGDIDATRYYNPFWSQVSRKGLYHQYEDIVPFNYEYLNQIPSVYQHLYKGYYPVQHTYGSGYGYGLHYPYNTYENEYVQEYPIVDRQIGY